MHRLLGEFLCRVAQMGIPWKKISSACDLMENPTSVIRPRLWCAMFGTYLFPPFPFSHLLHTCIMIISTLYAILRIISPFGPSRFPALVGARVKLARERSPVNNQHRYRRCPSIMFLWASKFVQTKIQEAQATINDSNRELDRTVVPSFVPPNPSGWRANDLSVHLRLDLSQGRENPAAAFGCEAHRPAPYGQASFEGAERVSPIVMLAGL